MRLILLAIICVLGLSSCAPPDNEAGASTSDLILEGDVSSDPEPATGGVAENITFNVANVSSAGTTYSNVPYTVTLYDASTQITTTNYLVGTIATIAAGTTVSTTFSDTQAVSGTVVYTIILDPNNTTNAVQSPGMTSYTLVWTAGVNG
jgi:hypothetical protein